MFEKTRKDLVERLGSLTHRFEAIAERANEWLQKARQAERLNMDSAESQMVLHEISAKANQQAMVSGEAITSMLVDRALPLIFKGPVRKAEAFAAQCEAVLDDFDRAAQDGKHAFHDRMQQRG